MTAYHKRRDLLMECLQREMGDEIEIFGGTAGLHLLVATRDGRCECELLAAAEAAGVRAYPTSCHWMPRHQTDPCGRCVLVGFSSIELELIQEGVHGSRKRGSLKNSATTANGNSGESRYALHENARSAYPWLMMQPKGTHTSAKSQVSITHRYPLASRLEIGYALRAFLREMWYLHVHFACARLHAFYAMPLMPSRLDILATRTIVNIERKSSFAKRIVSRPHSGRFSRHSCTRQTEVLNAKRPLRILNRKPNRMGLEAKPRAPYLCYITARYNTLAA